MRLILLVMVFLACALIDSPEDYAWLDNTYSTQIALEYGQDREEAFGDGVDFSYPAAPEVATEDKVCRKESRLLRF